MKAEAIAWPVARETELRRTGTTAVQVDRTVDEAFRRYEKEASADHPLFAIRAGEICDLVPGDLVGRVANLRKIKNGTKRSVPLSWHAVDLLKLLPPIEDEAPVFGISTTSRHPLFRKSTARALVEGLTFHESRHLAITRLAKKLGLIEGEAAADAGVGTDFAIGSPDAAAAEYFHLNKHVGRIAGRRRTQPDGLSLGWLAKHADKDLVPQIRVSRA